MDATRFDDLIKWLTTRRLTRGQALRGVAASGLAALTGVGFLGEVGEAKKDKPKKTTICHRGSDFSILGTTKKVTKKGKQKHLRSHPADFEGKCAAGLGCVSANCPKFETCVNNQCGPCTLASQCAAGEACLNGRCIGGSGRNAIACNAPPECQAFSAHLSCEEVGTSQFFCLAGTECAPAIQRPVVCPTAGETCVLGDCVVPCGAGDTCGAGFECRGGWCFD